MSMPCGDGKDALGARAALRTLGALCTLAVCPHQAATHTRHGVQGPQRGGHGRRRVQSAGPTGSPYAASADVVPGAEVMRCSTRLHAREAAGRVKCHSRFDRQEALRIFRFPVFRDSTRPSPSCCPPAPLALYVSIFKSESFISKSISSASGSTATVAAEVWTLPPVSVSGTR